MPDDEKKEFKVLSELDFGTYIAFFLPGALGLYALIPLSPRVAELFSQVVSKDQSIGASLLLVIGSLVVGTVISGLRAVSLDGFLQVFTRVRKPNLNYKSIVDKDTRVAYKEALNNTYRYYQFYGNMFFALALYVDIKYVIAGADIQKDKALFVLDLVVLLGLFVQSRQSLAGTYKVLGQILGAGSPELSIVACAALASGTTGQAYQQSLAAVGGLPPYKWTLISGSFPAGLNLDVSGAITGIPSTRGLASVTVQVEDANKTAKSQAFSLKID